MKALFELFRRFDARRIFGFIRRLGGMSRPKVKCYDLRSTHALRVEGDLFPVARKDAFHISIHALRVEGDASFFSTPSINRYFYPRPPGGGRRAEQSDAGGGRIIFLSTPSGWRATLAAHFASQIWSISIHALRVEGDCTINANCPGDDEISIHALRVEGDEIVTPVTVGVFDFYPRPPGGGRPRKKVQQMSKFTTISIHALRVEGDEYFAYRLVLRLKFLSTPSGWRATTCAFAWVLFL